MASTVDAYTRPERPRPRSSFFTRDFLLALPFLALLYIQLAHHVLWRDELNALAITWASPTIPSLFWHIHHEGHPWLWYVILWIPSRFTQSVLVLKIVQGIISTAIILFVAFRSPFRTWEKVLILSGYFFLFEYTVLSRMYGVMLLLFVVYLWRRTTRPESPIVSAVLLALIASVDTIGIILSIALILEYAAAGYLRGKPLFTRRTGAVAALVYASITAFAVWSAKPAKDISWRTTGRPFKDAKDLSHLYEAFLNYTILPFLPVKSPRSHFFWNPDVHGALLRFTFPMSDPGRMLYCSFRGRWNLLMMIGVTIVAGTLFGHLIYLGSERHFGVVFLAFMAAAWIVRAENLTNLLAMADLRTSGDYPVWQSVWALIGSWERPFSYDKAAAEWIVQNHLENMPIVGDDDTSAVDVVQYLHRPVYMIECSCVDTYLLYSSRRDNYEKSWQAERVLEAAHYYHDQPILFMMVHRMHPDEWQQLEAEGFQIEPLAEFSEAEEVAENFYFYRLTLVDAPKDAAANTCPRRCSSAILLAQAHMPVPTLSVVVPCYNEQESIHACHEKLTEVLSALKESYEIVYVDDGSRFKTSTIARTDSCSRYACCRGSAFAETSAIYRP